MIAAASLHSPLSLGAASLPSPKSLGAASLASPKSLGAARPCPQLLRSRSMPRVSAAYVAAPARDAAPAAASLYDVLEIPSGATGQEIKAAYRRLARACHPDVVATERKGTSADEFMRIHAAYATLSDPDKRADYDRRLVSWCGPRRSPAFSRSYSYTSSSSSNFSAGSPSTSSPFSGFSRRSWETDQCW